MNEKLLDHVKDVHLYKLYERMHDYPYESLLEGQKFLDDNKETVSPTDELAYLHVMNECIRVILEDLGEHGDANIEEYGNNNESYFYDRSETIKLRIAELEKAGAMSGLFLEYKRKYDKWMDKRVQEFMDELDLD